LPQRKGFDMPNMPFALTANNTKLCYDACQATDGCAAWVMDPCGLSCWLKYAVGPLSGPLACRVSGTRDHELAPPALAALPVGSVAPQGWLLDELRAQAAGLSGHLPLFWADVQNSSWVGGGADGGLHERTPYWLNGVAVLAHQVQDAALSANVQRYIDTILARQAPSGWLGPDDNGGNGDEYWGSYFVLLALSAHYEATGDARIPAHLLAVRSRLWATPLGDSWAAARWMDLVLSVHWLLETAPQGQEQTLYDLAQTLHDQGTDFISWFSGPAFPRGNVGSDFSMLTHGVNNAQALKTGAVWWRQSRDPTDAASPALALARFREFHGMPGGHWGADEHLAGHMPSHGTEVCTTVETMFSWSVAHGVLGDAVFAETAESIGYNTLPASFTKDMWNHPYLTQSNEVAAQHLDREFGVGSAAAVRGRHHLPLSIVTFSPTSPHAPSTNTVAAHVWVTDGPDSTIYGLEPNYGCCTCVCYRVCAAVVGAPLAATPAPSSPFPPRRSPSPRPAPAQRQLQPGLAQAGATHAGHDARRRRGGVRPGPRRGAGRGAARPQRGRHRGRQRDDGVPLRRRPHGDADGRCAAPRRRAAAPPDPLLGH
jgi:hypothetical protein